MALGEDSQDYFYSGRQEAMSNERIATFDGWLIRYHKDEPVTEDLYRKYLLWHMGHEEPHKP
jgi:hypothetical protein